MAKPEISFKAGAVKASVFVNEVQTAKGKASFKTVSLQRAYKDKEGQFKNTSSFREEDLPKAILVLGKAYEHLLFTERTA